MELDLLSIDQLIKELVSQGFSEKDIIDGFGNSDYFVGIVKVQRPLNDPSHSWLIYSEDRSIEVQAPREFFADNLEKRSGNKWYCWFWYSDTQLGVETEIECEQDRSW